MEGKFVIMSVVLVSFLVLGQIQVEAQTLRSCCPSTSARNIYNTCRFAGGSQSLCANAAGCRRLATCPAGWTNDILENTAVTDTQLVCCPSAKARFRFNSCPAAQLSICAKYAGCILGDGECPADYPHDILQHTSDNAVNEYCKSGCVSSVCGAISTLQDSDASEIVNGAVEKCTDVCSAFCTKKASITTAVETA